ncbi:MAG TPA: TRAP transporter small permease [Burkholderiales bacterium]|nr:TRAP transporter small permease [Burkholderiales bacterium]
MTSYARLRAAFERLLEWIVIALMTVLFLEVTVGVVFRAAGASLVWYDEVASILLAWLTYYASALAALKRAHIGFPGLVRGLEPRFRVPMVLFAEALVIAFFVLLAWVGYTVLEVLATDHLVSLPTVPVALTQSVIPIGATLYVIAELLNLPQVLAEARGRPVVVHESALAEKLH